MHRAFYLNCIIKMEQTILKYSIEIPPKSIRHLFSYQTVGMNVYYRNFHLYIKPLYQPKILRLSVAYHFRQWHMKKLILKDMAPVSFIRIYLANSSTDYGLMFRGFPLKTFIEFEMNCVFLYYRLYCNIMLCFHQCSSHLYCLEILASRKKIQNVSYAVAPKYYWDNQLNLKLNKVFFSINFNLISFYAQI